MQIYDYRGGPRPWRDYGVVLKVILSGILYNEASCIAECLDTFLPIVDKVVFTDTGSTDGTPEVVRAWMQKNNIPGIVYSVPWDAYAEASVASHILLVRAPWP